MKIYPLTGVDDIYLGFSTDEVKNQIGEPDHIEFDDWPNNERSINWIYKLLGLEFRFDSEDEYRLCVITITSRMAQLDNIVPIGLSEGELKSLFPLIILDDDFEENGKDYIYPNIEVSFWLVDGIVDNISIFSKYDEKGEIALWPKVRS